MTVDHMLRAPVWMTLWRDRDPEARRLPGMCLGEADFRADPVGAAASLHQQGARFVSLSDPVDLGGTDPERALLGLALVRELTSYGIAVDWEIDLGDAVADGRLLSHLHPPRAVLSAGSDADVLRDWRESYYITRCGYRCGPQFVEVRDYRMGAYRRLVIRSRDYRSFLDPLLAGADIAQLPVPQATALHKQGLVISVGGRILWLPYRIRNWPLSHIMS